MIIFFLPHFLYSNLRQHSFIVQFLFYTKHEQYHHFFFIRIINVWNHLAKENFLPLVFLCLNCVSRNSTCMLLLNFLLLSSCH